MVKLAEQERYEEAGKTRDSIQAIASLNISPSIDLANGLDLDIFAILNGDERGVIVKLFMRKGKIISSTHTYFRHTHIFDENEAYKQDFTRILYHRYPQHFQTDTHSPYI